MKELVREPPGLGPEVILGVREDIPGELGVGSPLGLENGDPGQMLLDSFERGVKTLESMSERVSHTPLRRFGVKKFSPHYGVPFFPPLGFQATREADQQAT